ncbi:MAG: tRNA 2-thiouridine synthesizing protein D [Halobacteriales archaeon]|jgi:tRNA 2-thiouridine synthesizing protein D
MSHLGVVLTGGPFDSERWRTAYELGRAALDGGHEVTYFTYLDGILVPVTGQHFAECADNGLYDEMPTEKFQELLDDGAEVFACGLCVDARGVDAETDYPDDLKIGLLPDLADLIGEADRVVSL